MRVPETDVKLVHRLLGLKSGTITITKQAGQVVAVAIDGRTLDPAEYRRATVVPRETNQAIDEKLLTNSEHRA